MLDFITCLFHVRCRLGREMRDLRGKQKLPVDASAAHFIRHDAERLDKVRARVEKH